jgi:L-ascorbate metabolism protein UlaG (beta-lactamase superfamily)
MTHAILDDLRSTEHGVALCWLGNLSWLICADGQLIATDLDLDRKGRIQPSPIPTAEIAPALSVHLITHGHEDHFGSDTCRILRERSSCLFVVPASCVDKAHGLGIPASRLHVARPGDPFDLPDLHVAPLRALHGHLYGSVYRHANMEDCGYLFATGGKRFLQPGDTVLLHEHLEFSDVDGLFVSPTVHNTQVDRSAVLINAIEPRHIFPQHFGTYVQTDDNRFWTKGYPDELKAVLPRRMQERFHKLAQGQVFVVE